MSTETQTYISGVQAGGDLSAKQYFLMKQHSTTNQVTTCTGATDVVVGSLYNKPDAAGQGADVTALEPGSYIKVIVGGAGVTAGWVGVDASGELVTKTSDKDFVIGRVDKTWADGDIAEVLCMPCFLAV